MIIKLVSAVIRQKICSLAALLKCKLRETQRMNDFIDVMWQTQPVQRPNSSGTALCTLCPASYRSAVRTRLGSCTFTCLKDGCLQNLEGMKTTPYSTSETRKRHSPTKHSQYPVCSQKRLTCLLLKSGSAQFLRVFMTYRGEQLPDKYERLNLLVQCYRSQTSEQLRVQTATKVG